MTLEKTSYTPSSLRVVAMPSLDRPCSRKTRVIAPKIPIVDHLEAGDILVDRPTKNFSPRL